LGIVGDPAGVIACEAMKKQGVAIHFAALFLWDPAFISVWWSRNNIC
jgi:hypothetical protein